MGGDEACPSDYLPVNFPYQFRGLRSTAYDGVGFLYRNTDVRLVQDLCGDRVVVGVIDAAAGEGGL